MKLHQLIFIAALLTTLIACNNKRNEEVTTLSGLKTINFQKEINGDSTDLYVLENKNGMEVTITNYGGRIVSIIVPDKNGEKQDVVLGFESIDDYTSKENNLGATIGRYGNRINQGKITVAGKEYQLPQNNFGHTLHGGPNGFEKQVFNAIQTDEQTLVLTYFSKDGEEGFPGNLNVKVTMTVTNDNALHLDYEAETDKETVVNLTNHSYFNLSGNPNNSILDEYLTINADQYTPIDNTFMTTGEINKVEGTPMDFRSATKIGQNIEENFEQLRNGKGYDHNWVLNTDGNINKVAATLMSPKTGITMDVYTTEPGLQVYVGNFLDGTFTGKNNIRYNKRTAICLESQKYPDSPNKPNWPQPYLKPGDKYTSKCIYKFSIAQ